MAEKIVLELLNPQGEVETVYSNPAPRLSHLNGKTIGVIDNKKAGARPLLTCLEDLLQTDFPDIRFVDLSKDYNDKHRIADYTDRLRGINAAIYATGD